MSYVFFNPNPSGKRIGDCVIRAISKITAQPWEETYIDVALKGYELCDMPSSNAVWAAVLRQRGFRRFIISDECPDCYTVRDFCVDFPRGEFLLATGSHVVAVLDGDYYDAWDSGAEVPVAFWTKEVIHG